MSYAVYVRAKTSDDRWASVNVLALDDRSFKQFLIDKMCSGGNVMGLPVDRIDLTTPLTKEQAEET